MFVPNLSLFTLFAIVSRNSIVKAVGTTPITDNNMKTAVGLWFNNRDIALEMYGPISEWDTSNVTSMNFLFEPFQNITYDGDFDITSWDVSAVTNMAGMFFQADSFNQDISSWNVSSVVFMGLMFSGASSFNQNLGSWDVSSVERMNFMFENSTAFNQDIGAWNVSSVTYMGGMFKDASSFDQNIGSWDVSSVIDMDSMFKRAALFDQDLNDWKVSSVQEMGGMFHDATSFDQSVCWPSLDISFYSLKNMFCNSQGEFDIGCENSTQNYLIADTGCTDGSSSSADGSSIRINFWSYASGATFFIVTMYSFF